jgi:hypothetical protein
MLAGFLVVATVMAAVFLTNLQPGRGGMAFENGPPQGLEAMMADAVFGMVVVTTVAAVGLLIWRQHRQQTGVADE